MMSLQRSSLEPLPMALISATCRMFSSSSRLDVEHLVVAFQDLHPDRPS